MKRSIEAEETLRFLSKEQTKKWVQNLNFSPRQVVLLKGDVGAGKTQMVSWMVEKYSGDVVASPSFALHHHYDTRNGNIEHFDLYRLEDEDDLESTGFWDVFAKERGLVVIEWPERLNVDDLPLHWDLVKIEIAKGATDEERTVRLSRFR